ncbi:MAG: PIN domain-containing protein [Acidimicrobiales bacterium]
MIIVDTGPLYASVDIDDKDHERCIEILATAEGSLVVPLPVVIETAYLVAKRLGAAAEAEFLGSLDSQRALGTQGVDIILSITS